MHPKGPLRRLPPAAFFTTLVVTAVVTSQACGFWLDHVLRRGGSLLDPTDEAEDDVSPAATHNHRAAEHAVL